MSAPVDRVARTAHRALFVAVLLLVPASALLPADATGDAAILSFGQLPTPRHSTSAIATEDGLIFVFGGHLGSREKDHIARYDPVADVASALRGLRLPTAREGTAAAYVAPHAYILGGDDGSPLSQIVRFTPSTSGVTLLPVQLPHAATYAAAVAAGADVYLFGGFDGAASRSEIVRFTPATMEVSVVGHLPSGRHGAAAAWDGTAAWILGGTGAAGALAEVVRFDPATGDAAVVGALPSARHAGAAFSQGGHVYFLGGQDASGGLTQIVRVAADGTVLVMNAALPAPRSHAPAVWASGAAHLLGGCCPAKKEIIRYTLAPGAPAALDAVPELGRIVLAWQPPAEDSYASPLTAYRIFRAVDGGSESLLAEVAADVLAYTDEGVARGPSFTYRVAAVNDEGVGAPSAPATATPLGLPSAPQDVAAAPGGAGEILLYWTPPADDGGAAIEAYRVYAGDAPGGNLLAEVAADALAFAEAGLAPGATRWYRVTAVTALGEGVASAEVAATTHRLPGAPGTLVAARGDPGAIHLSWTAPGDDGGLPVTSYRVYGGDAPGDRTLLASVPADGALSFTEGGLDSGITRWYVVRAVTDAGEGAASNEAAASTYPLPSAPQDLVASTPALAGTLDIAWAAPADDGGRPLLAYRVYGGSAPGDHAFLAEVPASTLSFRESGLGPGAGRWYVVRAVTDAGEGAASNEATAATHAVPSAPSLVALSGPERNQVQLSWTEPATDGGLPITGYAVRRADVSGGERTLVAELDASARGFVDGGIPDGVTRYYVVSAVSDAGEGAASNEADAAAFAVDVPATLPVSLAHSSAVWGGSVAFVFGGLTRSGGDAQSLDHILMYVPGESEAQFAATLPSARHGTAAAWAPAASHHETLVQSCHPGCFTGIAYIVGGALLDGSDGPMTLSCHPGCNVGRQILEFNPGENAVTVLPTQLPHPLSGASSAWVPSLDGGDTLIQSCHPGCVAGSLLVIGGQLGPGDGDITSSCHPGCLAGAIFSFTPSSGELTQREAALPDDRSGMATAFTGSTVLLFGGLANGVPSADVWWYDPAADQLVLRPEQLPTPRWGASAVWTGEEAYVFGGEDANGPVDEILRYDPLTGTFLAVASLPDGRSFTSAVWDGGRAFVFGGEETDGTSDDIVEFRPTAPQTLTATAGPAAGEITLRWSPPSSEGLAPVEKYRVWRGTSTGDMVVVAEVPVGTETYVDGGLDNGARYFYKVSAVSSVGEGPQSVAADAVTFALPGAPRNLRAELVIIGTRLDWEAPLTNGGTPLIEYRVYGGPTGGPPTHLATVDASTQTWTDEKCRLLGECTYFVVAVNLVGEGPRSNEVRAVGVAPEGR